MSWMTDKRNLDASQLQVLKHIADEGNYLVTGDPGTGKSVILAYAALEWKKLNPKGRVCAITYTNTLVACLEEGLSGSGVNVMTFNKFIKGKARDVYDFVLVDESQDLRKEWAGPIKKRGRKFLFVGDYGQTLYGRDGGLMDRKSLESMFELKGAFDLEMTYRLPVSCRSLVEQVFPDRRFSSRVYKLMANAQIPLFHAADWDAEMEYVIRKAKNHAVARKPVAILFEVKRTIFHFFYTLLGPDYEGKVVLEKVNDELRKRNLPFRFFGSKIGDLKEGDDKPLTYVMTWHSSKGLDFETVILPNISESPCRNNPLYVAMTRARKNLVLSYSGKQNDQIEKALACRSVCLVKTDASGRTAVRPKGAQQASLF